MWDNDEDDDGDDTGLCCLLAIAAEFICNLGEFPTEKRRRGMM